MIIEGLVATLNPDGSLHVRPLGPRFDQDPDRMVLRPFKTSRTYLNLRDRREGVFHVTDDVLLLAKAMLGRLAESELEVQPGAAVACRVLPRAVRYEEFVVESIDDREDRVVMQARIVARGGEGRWAGFNRGKHAVVEAAVLASRTEILPLEEIRAEFRKLAVLVEKTGGLAEHEAFRLLEDHVREVAGRRGVAWA
jgi:hypothetical protein